MTSPATLTHLWRWPVKGLGGESLSSVAVKAGELFPFDRAFALENGPSDFDPDNPQHVAKRQFVCMVHQPATGRMTATYDDEAGRLAISTLDGRTLTVDPEDSSTLEKLAEELVDYGVRGPLKMRFPSQSGTGHGFTDVPDRWISVQNRASIAWLEKASGSELDPRRFRGNMLVDGWDAFEEEELVGKTIEVGTAAFRVEVPINRCRAIDVNPGTSEQDQELVRTLQGMRRKPSLGIYATIVQAGRMTPGDSVTVL